MKKKITKLIPKEALQMYKVMASEVLRDMLEEHLDNEGIDHNLFDIDITIKTRIKLENEVSV